MQDDLKTQPEDSDYSLCIQKCTCLGNPDMISDATLHCGSFYLALILRYNPLLKGLKWQGNSTRSKNKRKRIS